MKNQVHQAKWIIELLKFEHRTAKSLFQH